MTTICAASGGGITMSRLLAEGNEGGVYELLANPGRVAKVYHRPAPSELSHKLEAMIRMRSPELDEIAAWPIELLHHHRNEGGGPGECVGFLMPRVRAPGDLDRLSHPAQQKVVFPEVDYAFLIRVARNLMRAGAAFHRAGCIIGDVNQSNVRVLRDGSVRFADVDSFQIDTGSRVFACTVGTGIYTPPELHGPAFSTAVRAMAHDGFGLAVLVFELLMAGRHPYAGLAVDGRARSIEESIREGLYAYAGDGRVQPPAGAMPIAGMGDLSPLFKAAFTSTDRPSAGEWAAALERAEAEARPCGRNPRHRLLPGAPACPLCASGEDPLPALSKSEPSRFPVDEAAMAIADADDLGRLRELRRRFRVAALKPEQIVANRPSRLPLTVGAGAIGVVVGSGMLAFTWAGLAPGMVGAVLVGTGLSRRRRRERRIGPLRAQAEEAHRRLARAEAEIHALDSQARAELEPLRAPVAETRAALAGADQRWAATIDGADASFRQFCLDEHLRARLIARAGIPGVGVSWRAMLASFGIETALDVTPESLQRVPALRADAVSELLAWRLESEQSVGRAARAAKAPQAWAGELLRRHGAWMSGMVDQLRRASAAYRAALEPWEQRLAARAAETDEARRSCRLAMALLQRPPEEMARGPARRPVQH